jgi:hypothetical protein
MNERYAIQVEILKHDAIQPVLIEYRRQIAAL